MKKIRPNSRSSFRAKKGEKILKKEGFTLLYLGHEMIPDVRAADKVLAAIMAVKQSPTDQSVVQIFCQGTQLYVKEGNKEILTSPLTNISQCSHHSEQGFNDCFGLVFSSGPWFKQCHIFQAKSSKEASEVVLSIHKSVKAVIKSYRRKSEVPPSALFIESIQIQEGSRRTQRRKSDGGLKSITSEPIPIVKVTDLEPDVPITSTVKPSPWKRRKELSRIEKIEIVEEACMVLKESNNLLKQACSNPHPQSPFERALHAINLSSDTLLSYLLDQHMLGVDACDHDGNTLVHYAVAMLRTQAIEILYERMASLEHHNKHKVRPLHRAVNSCNKHVIMALLERGVNPNVQDEHRNTPLHYAASSREQHETCWVLLQYGAMIHKPNKDRIRPIDILPDLKEMQNRLIVSMCKSFCDPREKVTIPNTSLFLTEEVPTGFSELLWRVKEQAKSLKLKLRKHKMKKISHSISNLSELLEAEEDEMIKEERLQKLKFPLLSELPIDNLQLESDKEEVEKRLNKLIHMSKKSQGTLKRSTSDPELSSLVAEKGTSEQHQSEISDNFKRLLHSFGPKNPPPHSLIEAHNHMPPRDTPSLSSAFDGLEADLEQTLPFHSKEIIKISPKISHHPLISSKSEGTVPKSSDEVMAELDDYISQIKCAAESIAPLYSNEERLSSHTVAQVNSAQTPTSAKHTYSDTTESFSSSDKRSHQSAAVRGLINRGHSRIGSTGSNISVGSSSSSSNPHHESLLNFPMDVEPGEPGAHSLRVLVLLSQNPECIQPLISHICLSEFKQRLIASALSPTTSISTVSNVANLVYNIFEVGGSDGRKTAVESGMMDIVLKLLSTRDPIPGTCLLILDSLLVSGDDNDYLRTIATIPCDPLMSFLDHSDSDADSGLGSQRERDPSSSSFENQASSLTEELKHHSHLSTILVKDRAFSGTSESSSTASPTLQGDVVTHVEARRIVLKLLAVSSTHTKMQVALSNPRCIGLLAEYVSDVSLENKTSAVIALANIAQNVNSHQYIQEIGLIDKLCNLLSNGPRPRYQAMRALVYLGNLQLPGCSLFDSSSHGGYEPDPIITAIDRNGHTYVRGLTIEAGVDLLTSNIKLLWGGIVLCDNTSDLQLSKERTVDFFLTTYRSFLHPLIFMRLLLHRLDVPGLCPNPFFWSQDVTEIRHAHVHVIPSVHQSVLNVIGQWIETYPEDFRFYFQLQDYLGELVLRLKKFKGVYTPHAHRLKSLLHDVMKPNLKKPENSSVKINSDTHRIPHHENLYLQCKQMVSEDLLPVTLQAAIYLAGLQLHIEILANDSLYQSFMEGGRGKRESRIYLNHLKHALPAWCFRLKNISKKVREKVTDFEGLSDRNAKHMYIEKCQACPGYHCRMFNIKVPIEGKFRRGYHSQLLGISDSHIIFLEEKTRELIITYSLQDFQNIHHLPNDCCTLITSFTSGQKVLFQVERESIGRQIEMLLDNQRVLDDIKRDDLDDWIATLGQSPSSVQLSTDFEEGGVSQSSTSLPDNLPNDLEDTITPTTKEETEPLEIMPPATHKGGKTPSTLLDENTAQNYESSFSYPEVEKQGSKLPFCDCPPDPEIPLHMDIHFLSLQEILLHPVEVARQVTLIEHEKLARISREELLQRAGMYPRTLIEPAPSSRTMTSQSRTSIQPSGEGIEQLAYRFNQLGNWIVHSILQYPQEDNRGWVIQQFISTAYTCLQYNNYSSTMAIVVGGLCSPSIRRLSRTWEHVGKSYKDQLNSMTDLLSSRNNYKNYRDVIEKAQVPAIPYFGIFTKDLTFILDGNPDYLRNLVNLHKRRQIYTKLQEIKRFQSDPYKFQPVHALQNFLTHHVPVSEDDLHALSHSLEPPNQDTSLTDTQVETNRIHSSSISSLTNLNLGLFKHSYSRGSGSSSNLLSI